MSRAVAAASSKPLVVDLLPAINEEHAKVVGSARQMGVHAIRCGELLIQAKENLEHGEWMQWLDGNVEMSRRTAQVYMQVATANAQSSAHFDGGSIMRSLAAISTPRLQQKGPELDPASAAGKMLGAAKTLGREGLHREVIVDAEVVETAPQGIEDRRWVAALKRADEMRGFMNEAANTSLAREAIVEALQDASTAARRVAIDLEQLAGTALRSSR